MNCVFDAICQHLRAVGEEPQEKDRLLYEAIKLGAQGSTAVHTFGGIVPAIASGIASEHGLGCAIEHSIWTPAHYLAAAENDVQRNWVGISDFGRLVNSITLTPAIYLLLDERHAIFSESPPPFNLIVMAIQLTRQRNGE